MKGISSEGGGGGHPLRSGEMHAWDLREELDGTPDTYLEILLLRTH